MPVADGEVVKGEGDVGAGIGDENEQAEVVAQDVASFNHRSVIAHPLEAGLVGLGVGQGRRWSARKSGVCWEIASDGTPAGYLPGASVPGVGGGGPLSALHIRYQKLRSTRVINATGARRRRCRSWRSSILRDLVICNS